MWYGNYMVRNYAVRKTTVQRKRWHLHPAAPTANLLAMSLPNPCSSSTREHPQCQGTSRDPLSFPALPLSHSSKPKGNGGGPGPLPAPSPACPLKATRSRAWAQVVGQLTTDTTERQLSTHAGPAGCSQLPQQKEHCRARPAFQHLLRGTGQRAEGQLCSHAPRLQLSQRWQRGAYWA